ncbi:VirB8/TrbF family protein [Acinetobacter johnsonii]|uniref:VirB8/TrbF family protein n=1 Tax=Acinetobacter johnsonii TaxID=40214 RepID=UPI0030AFE5F3
MFNKSKKGTEEPTKSSNSKTPTSTNPYLNGRREWMERYGSYIKERNRWRIVSMITSCIALVSVLGIIYIGSQSKFIPYIVQVDKLGASVATQRADIAQKPDSRIVKAQIASFIESSRSVYTDFEAQKGLVNNVYGMLKNNSPAANKMTTFYKANIPFKRAESETVSVQIHDVLPISENSWRVQWLETKHNREGLPLGSTEMSAIITVMIAPPTDELNILKNPMGVYVQDFNWTAKI